MDSGGGEQGRHAWGEGLGEGREGKGRQLRKYFSKRPAWRRGEDVTQGKL